MFKSRRRVANETESKDLNMVGYEYMRPEESDGDGAAIKRMTKIVPWTKE